MQADASFEEAWRDTEIPVYKSAKVIGIRTLSLQIQP